MSRRTRRVARARSFYPLTSELPRAHVLSSRYLLPLQRTATVNLVRRALLPPPPFPHAKRAFRKARMFRQLGALAMRAPSRVDFCIRRKQRREVLFAVGRAGFSGSTRGRYRRTQESQYAC